MKLSSIFVSPLALLIVDLRNEHADSVHYIEGWEGWYHAEHWWGRRLIYRWGADRYICVSFDEGNARIQGKTVCK
jgi:hypothetical protein